MSRSLKPSKAEHYFDSKTRQAIDLMLDRNENTFFAVVQHEKLTAPAIHELRQKVKAALAKLAPVKWERVLELSVSQGHRGGYGNSEHIESHEAELSVEFKRFEIGKTSTGVNLKRPFPEDEHEMWRKDIESVNPLMHSSTDYDVENAHRIPYTDAVWTALTGVKDTLEAAYKKLEPLFDPKDRGQKLLALTGVKLLPASTDVVDAQPVKKARR